MIVLSCIVFVHLFNDRSGSPKVLSQVISAMAQHGADVEVLTSNYENGFLNGLPGIRRNIFYRRSENKLITLFYFLIAQIFLFIQCLSYCRRDVIFYVNTMMPCGAALAARLMGKQVIYHLHETSLRPALLKKILRLVIRLTASKIIFVSNYLCKVEGFCNIPQYVVHNALSINIMQKPVRQMVSKFDVLMICSLKKYKGVLEFFEIAKKLLCQPSIHFTLVLNAEQQEIDSWIVGVDIPDNIAIFSRQNDVLPFYNNANLLLNLSRPDEWIETFGLTILEGMAQGLPVIAPPVGGPAEIISDGKEGFLISCYETTKIADMILKLASDHEYYSHLAHNAWVRANDFSLTSFKENIIKVIES